MPSVQYPVKEMLNTNQAAGVLGVSSKTIYRMEQKGLIRSVRTPGGQRRFAKSILEDYLNKSQEFVAPQNPSKFLIRENGSTYTLFKESELKQEVPTRQRIDRLEQVISLGSSRNHQQHYDKEVNPKRWVEEWDFKFYKTKIYTHGFHNYPAMFIPQVARKLILAFSNEGDMVCDIFCGSGTTMVESSLLNRDSIGIELNPLAVLIARAKTTPIDPKTLTTKL
ncbi:MAG: helix-turn-helix domain-containing protein, partial [Planctomycetota bacterium]|nr:helix-turn-helix domain-containing protein [Planctomycetota bacterium]